jgi:hypothetical protein
LLIKKQAEFREPCPHFLRPALQTAPCRYKTTPYRLYTTGSDGWQGGFWMTKDGNDVVEPMQQLRGASSGTNPPLETKPSLVFAANPAQRDRC